ncbi:hypothetical protein HDU83_002506 [Entophlyctis luteolus]|nr:hypothetical protein HDU82_000279 [Entophlyctis luteolus]KAJ3355858.1 hypothetical protein HDU83_002506 [Entophlyctis luteolus]KAJ3391383.1 hypothetical protein HDU84_006128 [Entophlyctis sp. JEL0112]
MRQPVHFIAHGSPLWIVDSTHRGPQFLTKLGKELLGAKEPPKAFLFVAAHWETSNGLKVTTSTSHSMVYDYYGFPKHFYDVNYPAKGSPEVAAAAIRLLKNAGFTVEPETKRGIDHGVFTPLMYLAPKQEIPVVVVSLPITNNPTDYFNLGVALQPLRDEGVAIIGAGYGTHNLMLQREIFLSGKYTDPLVPWAEDFVGGMVDAAAAPISERKAAVLSLFKRPTYRTAHPAPEHFAPFVVAAGAAGEDKSELISDWWYGGMESGHSWRFGELSATSSTNDQESSA